MIAIVHFMYLAPLVILKAKIVSKKTRRTKSHKLIGGIIIEPREPLDLRSVPIFKYSSEYIDGASVVY